MTQAFLAGFLIGIGDIALMSSVNIYIGAFLFCVALLCIIYFELPLFTGKIGIIYKNRQFTGYIFALVFNVVGATFAVWLFSLITPENKDIIKQFTDLKFSDKSYLALFVAGALCNVLIHLAASTKHTIIVILCVMTFIICGFRHSIADSAYAFYSLDWHNIVGWLFVLLGNTVGAIVTEWMLTFLKDDSSTEENTDAVDEIQNPNNSVPGMSGMFGSMVMMGGRPSVDNVPNDVVATTEGEQDGSNTESE